MRQREGHMVDIKQQLVDAIRMLERAGYIDHNGHCSARRDENSFYINTGASVRGAGGVIWATVMAGVLLAATGQDDCRTVAGSVCCPLARRQQPRCCRTEVGQ